jgi:hypothetical protein
MRHLVIGLLLALTLVVAPTCAKAPPNLSPQGVTDWNTLQIGHDLDLIRDIVDAGAKQTVPVFTRDVDVKVATWHKAAVTTLASRADGWKTALMTGLDQLLASLSQTDRDRLTPYALLIKTVLASS